MQAIRGPASIADKIKTQFAIAALYRLVYLARRHVDLTHDDLKMPDQRLHLGIYIILRGQIIFGNIGMIYFCFRSFELLYLSVCLFDNAKALPHLLVTHQETIVAIAGCTYRDIELKIFITAIGRMHSNIIIYYCCAKISSRE